jgi:hypothetical protein
MEYQNIIPLERPFQESWPLIVPELYKDLLQDKIIPEISLYLIHKALKKLLDGNDYFYHNKNHNIFYFLLIYTKVLFEFLWYMSFIIILLVLCE